MKKLIVLVLTWLPAVLMAQSSAFPDFSPQVQIRQEIGNTQFELKYSRPAVRGRKIFGNLVPYGQLWRTGAAECSTLSFSKAVEILGNTVPAGKYSLLSIPDKQSWVIILNADTTLYGLSQYDATKDIIRFKVPVQPTEEWTEAFAIHLDFVPNDARLTVSWEHTRVSFLIETSTNVETDNYIRSRLLTRRETNDENYVAAADFLIMNNLNAEQALLLTDYALEIRDSEYVRNTRVGILERLGRKQEAQREVFAAIELVKLSKTLSEKDRKTSLEFWQKKLEELR